MRFSDLFKYSFKALRERKLRAALTIIGILIGPATIVALVGATQGYSNAATSRFESLGANSIFVSPVGRGFSITDSVVQEIQALPDVSYAIPYQEASGQVTQGGETVQLTIVAMNLTMLDKVFPTLSLETGTVPPSTDAVDAVAGYSIAYPGIKGAENLTTNEVLTATDVRSSAMFSFASVGGGGSFSGSPSGSSSGSTRSFVVTGILNSFGSSFFLNPDDSIFVQPAAGQQILDSSAYTGVVVVASSSSDVSAVTTELTDTLGQNVRTEAVTSLVSTIQSVTSGTSTLLEAVAGTSVAVAFVGIMTTMLTSVMERTTEIGVLKSLGAKSRTIMLAFLSEAAITGLIGGAVGAAVGAGLSYLVISVLSGTLGFGGSPSAAAPSAASRAASGAGGASFSSFGLGAASSSSSSLSIAPSITPELVLIAIGIAAAVGLLGGLLPAWRASRLTPVEALHRS